MREMNTPRLIGMYVLLVLLIMLAAACGNTSGNDQAGQADSSPQSEGAQHQELPADPPAEAPAANEQQAQPRTYIHDFGAIEVPASPERIVGIYLDDYLLSLGVKPLTQTMYGKRVLPYLQDQIGDLPTISPGSINLELILEEKPDLILLAYPFYAEEGRYDLFTAIAPTYVFTGEEGWRQTLRTVGDVIGKPEQAEAWLHAYDQKAGAARDTLRQAIGDETVMFVRFTRAERIQVYGGPSNFSADVLYGDLGLQPSAFVKEFAWGEQSAPLISAEVIAQFDADHIFITYDNPDNDDAKEFKNHPLWTNIPAVKNGNLHEVEMFHWMNDGPISNSTKIDDVLNALVK